MLVRCSTSASELLAKIYWKTKPKTKQVTETCKMIMVRAITSCMTFLQSEILAVSTYEGGMLNSAFISCKDVTVYTKMFLLKGRDDIS